MANREIFAKHIKSNVKLATRYDAEGREVQVERREDADATAKEYETFDLLIKAGYHRACIRGLSSFDKVVGGMTWCIECCDYDVDVDLLFHENLTIGQKIALVEKIVSVLPQMKCPFQIEPHQIQGLEFLSIHPVIQWLVKKSVENRNERNLRIKKFAVGQFHNNYQFESDRKKLETIHIASQRIKHIQEIYIPIRQFQCKATLPLEENEKNSVFMTLMEFGDRRTERLQDDSNGKHDTIGEENVENILKNLVSTNFSQKLNSNELNNSTRRSQYEEFKKEIETDVKLLTDQSHLKSLETTRIVLEKKLERHENETKNLKIQIDEQKSQLEAAKVKRDELRGKIDNYKRMENHVDSRLLGKVKDLLQNHDDLKKEENDFKNHCRKNLLDLQEKIEKLELLNAQKPEEYIKAIKQAEDHIQELKLQLAKCNRAIVTLERQLDDIPDRTELTQYQQRFHELYDEMNAKHWETKQYYTLYNTLNDKKTYMEKELSLLNSICEAYNEGMATTHGREDFIKQLESIVNGVKQTEIKVRAKYNEKRHQSNVLSNELQGLHELERQYAAAVKQLTKECQRCEVLQLQLKTMKRQN